MNRICYILFFLVSFHTGIYAQDPMIARLEDSWRQYQTMDYQEKIFLHTDKTFFLSGETLWFKIYNVDAATNYPGISVVAYVELLNKEQSPVLQIRVQLKEGMGAGSFILPSTLPSGNYHLRCYTSWMKNFTPSAFFHQQITIVNTFTNAAPDPANPPSLSVNFFPEGGNLVYGLASRVAFKAVDIHQHGVDCSGVVVDEDKDTVAKFRSAHLGMGSFTFTPQKGKRYKAVAYLADTTITQNMPAAFDDGYVMHLTKEDNRIKVLVNAAAPPATGTSTYLFIEARHRLTTIRQTSFTGSQALFYIDIKDLDEGLSHFTIFNQDRVPVCERLYCPRLTQLNTMTISPQLSQQSYGLRKRADLTLSATDRTSHPVNANLSLSVFLIDSLQPIPTEDITTYLTLASELNGVIEEPQYYMRDSSADAADALDNLLLTQGWSRFKWEDIFQHKKPYFESLPETNGSLITGKIIDKTTGHPAPPTIGYLSVPGKAFTFSAAKSRSDGSIVFNTKHFTGTGDIIVQTNSTTADSNYRIDLANPFYDRPDSWTPAPFNIAPALQNQLLGRSIDMQVENAYLRDLKRQWRSDDDKDTLPFYGLGDHGYRLDDYTRFQTTEEVLHEYVEEVHLARSSGKVHFRVRNNLFNTLFDDDPLMLIDGVPVYDAEKILAINPLKFRQIDVVARKFYTGPLINDGIVSYKTYEGDLGGYQLDPNAVAIHYEGIQLQQEFYTPIYDKGTPPSSRIPDFRNLLQWSPDLHTGEDGKLTTSFYTSDIPGTYLVFVQGITDRGQPGSRMMTFTVH